MEILVFITVIASVLIVVGGVTAYKFYQVGYNRGVLEKNLYAQKQVAEYQAEQQWSYDDSFNPQTRYNKFTGETQKRYPKRIAGMQSEFTEWRTITATKADEAGKN